MQIPFNNLKAQHKTVSKEIEGAITSSIQSFNFIRSKEVVAFANVFAKTIGANHCITTGNGTASLFIALKSLNIGIGDEVITPALSWISSSETISLCGATPVFVDVDKETYTLNPLLIEEKITLKTKAIIAVHLYGQAAHISQLQKLCKKHNLLLIEDCAQAQLTQEMGKHVGTFGDVSAFSFYPTKNLGAYGDAGCIITNNAALAERMNRFANHGAVQKDDHTMEGINSRMDTIQAAVLLAKLPYLKQWTQKRIENAQLYGKLLEDVEGVAIPFVRPKTLHTFHLYVIRARRRDQLKDFLLRHGIQTIIHYPKALPNLLAYSYLNLRPEDFPVSSAMQDEVLSLPIYPELKVEEIIYIAEKIKEFYKK